jgi:hypothetical protein
MRAFTLLAPLIALALSIAAPPAHAGRTVDTRGWRIASITGEVEASLSVRSPLSCQDPAVQQEKPEQARQNVRAQYRSSFTLKEVRGGEYTPDLKRSDVYRGPLAIGGPVGVRLNVRRSTSETDRVLSGQTSTNPDTNEDTYACSTQDHSCTVANRQTLSMRLSVHPTDRRGGPIGPRRRGQMTQVTWPAEVSRFLQPCSKDESPLLEVVPSAPEIVSRHSPGSLSGRRGVARIDRTVPIDTGSAQGTLRYRATMRLRRVVVRCNASTRRFTCRDRSA